jgi:N-acyl-phosphatidylethanolamine-hydrolysing phospholipase D
MTFWPFRRQTRFSNPHKQPSQFHSLFELWEALSLWAAEVVLTLTGLKRDPEDLIELKDDPATSRLYPHIDCDKPTAMWVNHSSFFVSTSNVHFITDPIWSRRCSPVSFAGPVRHHLPARAIDNMPPIDFVLISHNHYDHLDSFSTKAIKKLNPNVLFCVPLGCGPWFAKRKLPFVEFDWWQSGRWQIGDAFVKITAVPAQHFSGRGLFDHNDTLWVGFVVEVDTKKQRRTFYYCGDTGYNPLDFKEIAAKLGPFDLSLIPIGAYQPSAILSPIHIDPYEAVKVHKEVGSALSLACHHSTFALGQEPLGLPRQELVKALEQQGVDPKTFLAPQFGQWVNW